MKLGVLGGGQLARMMALAAYPLGIRTFCLDPSAEACAGQVADLTVASYDDKDAIAAFLAQVDVVTIETENIPLDCVSQVMKSHAFYPPIKALEISQDRYLEKKFLQSLGIATPEFYVIHSEQELAQRMRELGFPALLKTRRFGYDGKGQYLIKSEEDITKSWNLLKDHALILESFISFHSEYSLIAVRNKHGAIAFYPMNKNYHNEGILRTTEVLRDGHPLEQKARDQVSKIIESLNYVGVFTIEYFYDGEDLIANEMAPRVHNSGHWTIEGACTSQFEQHLRALFDLPLGSTDVLGHCFMVNCLGEMTSLIETLNISHAHYHDYGKSKKPNRKVGHVTLVDGSPERFEKKKSTLLGLVN